MIRCAVPFAFAAVLWRGLRDRGYWDGLGERFGFGAALRASSIWVHAVSLGEMTAAAPLIRALRARHPQIPVVVTTATPAGRSRARALFADGVDIRFLPYDTPGAVRRFLARIKPRAAIILETELWPNLFMQCARNHVPVLIANARLSPRSVSRYQRLDRIFGGLLRGIFTSEVSIAAQSEADAARFAAIGASASQTRVTGNIKFDLQLEAGIEEKGVQLRAAFGAARPVWIAGSTHAGEEEQLLAAHALLLRELPDALLLLVPRHKDRFAGVADLLERRGVKFARRGRAGMSGAGMSGAGGPRAEETVLLVDSVGELAAFYAAADIAFVGGSLVPVGGHNMLEPAALGLPVLTGPHHFNSRDVAQLLLGQGAAWEVANAEQLAAALRRWFDDPGERRRVGAIGKQIIAANRGSVARLLEIIEQWLG
jgi:3-deoxy-D-manno-octulosonic-acid transferase